MNTSVRPLIYTVQSIKVST